MLLHANRHDGSGPNQVRGNNGKSTKRALVSVLLTVLLVGAAAATTTAHAQYDVIYQFYYTLSSSPETGDSLIASNQEYFDERFDNCMGRLLSKFQALALDNYRWCYDVFNDPDSVRNCQQENEPAKIHHWLRDFYSAAQGDVLWSGTIMGQASMIAKREMVNMGMGPYYQQIVDTNARQIGPELVCR